MLDILVVAPVVHVSDGEGVEEGDAVPEQPQTPGTRGRSVDVQFTVEDLNH